MKNHVLFSSKDKSQKLNVVMTAIFVRSPVLHRVKISYAYNGRIVANDRKMTKPEDFQVSVFVKTTIVNTDNA